MLSRAKPPWALWAAVSATLGALGVGSVLLVRAEPGPRPPFLDASPSGPVAPVPRAIVEVAGSGSNLPLTRALASAFVAAHPGPGVVVHESIGSRGGVLAVHDGAIDVGLVSRDLTATELGYGLTVVPYARVPVVWATNPSVPDQDLTPATLLALYRGERTAWSDGTPVVVLQREPGDSSHLAAAHVIPEFARVDEEAWREGRWRVLYHDLDMQEALVATPGAIGLLDYGAIVSQRLTLRIVRVDGVRPSPETVASGAWRFTKDLSFVIGPTPPPRVAQLLAYVRSEAGQRLIRESGYVPR